jgi:O-antigen/teichoic acid export membrane protein
MGSTQVVLIVISIIRTKYLAVHIGPEGYGLYSLLEAFFQLGTIFTGAALADASIKYISEYNEKGEKEKVQQIFDFSFSFIFIAITFVTFIFIVFYPLFKTYFLSKEVVFSYYSLFAASFVGNTLSSSVFSPLLTGFKQIKKIVSRTLINSFFSLVSVVLLVFFFDLTGFFLSAALASFFGLYLFWKEGLKLVKIRVSYPEFRTEIGKKLLSFFSMNFLLGITWMGSSYLQRILVVNRLNIASLGLFSAATSLNRYLGMVIEAAKYHTYPKLSEDINTEEKNIALNDYFRLSLLYSLTFSVFMINFAPFVIVIFYSKLFTSLADVFYIFVIAQLLANLSWTFTWTIVGMAKMKFYVFATIITHVLVVLVPFLMINEFGIFALGLGSIISSIQHMLFNGTYLWKRYRLGINKNNIYLSLIAASILVINVLFKDFNILINFSIVSFSCIVIFYTLSKVERIKIYSFVKLHISRK